MKVSVTRRAHFNAAHRLHVKEWSDAKNKDVFGVCNNPNFHGHNYNLDITVTGETDPVTGMLLDLKDLKTIIEEEVVDRFDHQNLNMDTTHFAELNPTAENIAFVIHGLISNRLGSDYSVRVRLYETDRNIVDYPALP